MRTKITIPAKRKFYEMRSMDYSIKRCSEVLGISYNSGLHLEKLRKSGEMFREFTESGENPELMSIKALIHQAFAELSGRDLTTLTATQLLETISKATTALQKLDCGQEQKDDIDLIWEQVQAENQTKEGGNNA